MVKKQNSGQNQLKTGFKNCSKMTIRIPDSPVFGVSLYRVTRLKMDHEK
jgi:hypothetical protein